MCRKEAGDKGKKHAGHGGLAMDSCFALIRLGLISMACIAVGSAGASKAKRVSPITYYFTRCMLFDVESIKLVY